MEPELVAIGFLVLVVLVSVAASIREIRHGR